MTIRTIEALDASRAAATCGHPLEEVSDAARITEERMAVRVRTHDAAHGLPADLVISMMRLYAADPASVTAIGEVVAERLRQIEGEGWTAAHDDAHGRGEMALAGASYAWFAGQPAVARTAYAHGTPPFWPWAPRWWKSGVPSRELCKANALLIAERAKEIRAAEQPAATIPCPTCGRYALDANRVCRKCGLVPAEE